MRRLYLSVFIVSTLIPAVGCGIPEDKHNAVLKDLEACKSTLAATKNNLVIVKSIK